MAIDVRTITESEVPEFQVHVESVFGGDPDADEMASWRPLVEVDRTTGAFDGGLVGTAAVMSFEMTVPGGPVPAAGVTAVGVRPTHRRRGVLTSLMRHQLAEVRERGDEAFATLWASEASIYPRFGYGVAGRRWNATVHAHDPEVTGAAPAGGVRLADSEEMATLGPAVYEPVRVERPAMISRSPQRWAAKLVDPPAQRQGGTAFRYAVYERDGEPRGYAWYRTKPDWTDDRPNGAVRVRELVARDADACLGLWRYLLGIDLMRSVAWDNYPADDPLAYRLRDPRAMRVTVSDGVYVRLLDVPRALTERSYATSGRVVLDVVDEAGGWAAGRYALDASPEGATCEPTSASADLSLSVNDLSAAYLGDTRLLALHDAGRVDEHNPGAAERASALLAWPRPAWCPDIF